MPELTSQQQFDNIVNKYLENVATVSDGNPEFEIRFGTKGVKAISKIDFDNVIQKLKSSTPKKFRGSCWSFIGLLLNLNESFDYNQKSKRAL